MGCATTCNARSSGLDGGRARQRLAIAGNRCQSAFSRRLQQVGELVERQLRQLTNIEPGKGDGQGFVLQLLTLAQGTQTTSHVLRHALFHQRALCRCKGVEYIVTGASKSALVAGLHLASQRGFCLLGGEARVHRNGRSLVGEQNPVAVFFWKVLPRRVNVVAQRHKDVAQILPVPSCRPCSNRAFTDGQGVVWHH